MEPEGSLQQSQVPATCPYPEPVPPSPTSHFLKIHLNIILPSTSGSPKWSLSFRFPRRNTVYTSPLSHTRYMPRPTPGNHQWKGAAPRFNRRGVQMIIGVNQFLSSVNKSSVSVFITTINSSVAEASTCTIKYFNEASVVYMFLTLDINPLAPEFSFKF
jgi:hypothetical protein